MLQLAQSLEGVDLQRVQRVVAQVKGLEPRAGGEEVVGQAAELVALVFYIVVGIPHPPEDEGLQLGQTPEASCTGRLRIFYPLST